MKTQKLKILRELNEDREEQDNRSEETMSAQGFSEESERNSGD